MLLILALVALSFANAEVLDDSVFHKMSLPKAWRMWKIRYESTMLGESYDEDARFHAFALNYAFVNMENTLNNTYTVALNKFAHLSFEEFAENHLGYDGYLKENDVNYPAAPNTHVASAEANPSSVDWREQNAVNDVKDQGNCGSCWTFSAIAALETQYWKVTGNLLSLSEQDMVDCCKREKLPGSVQTCCNGCSGGLMDYAFQYMVDQQNGHNDLENLYPYTARDGTCKYTENKAFSDAVVTGYTDISSESDLEDAVANVGVISVAVNANSAWQLYSGGVLNPALCLKNKLDHGVATVGYGTAAKGGDYWIVRNSWGTSWGENGYVRLSKGSNTCGIVNGPPSYPTMTKA